MKKLLAAMFVALLMVGCGEEAQKKAVQEEAKDDPSVPLAIPCVACGEKVSKKTTECRQCGHPTPDSVVAYKKAQELARIGAEERRKRQEEERKLAEIRAEKERKRQEEERRLAEIRAEKERKRQEELARKKAEEFYQQFGKNIAGAIDYTTLQQDQPDFVALPALEAKISELDESIGNLQTTLVANPAIAAVIEPQLKARKEQRARLISMLAELPQPSYTGWGKTMYNNGQISWLAQYKDGKRWSAVTWKPNGEKCPVTNIVDGNGVVVVYNDDGTEAFRQTFKDGELVLD